MRVREAVAEATSRLRDAGVDSPRHDAEELLAHVVGVPRTRVGEVGELSEAQAEVFEGLVVRRSRREPLQHLTGSVAFRYADIAVGPGVFVPRPETELLAGWAIDLARVLPSPVVVDLCAGSGAIALSVATEVPAATVHAVEIAPEAHAWAERNLARTSVDLRLGDIVDCFRELDGTTDIVVANPPYIPLGAFESVAVEARDHDPPQALWSGEDGLDAIRVVEHVAHRLLRPGGWVACEHADQQGQSAPALFSAAQRWTEVRDQLDLAGRPRFVTARRPFPARGDAAVGRRGWHDGHL